MANTHKTKAEMLQELESIKGLLLEEDDIPVLQEVEDDSALAPPDVSAAHSQTSLFDSLFDHSAHHFTEYQEPLFPGIQATKLPQHVKTTVPANTRYNTAFSQQTTSPPPRPLAKASGENPFLPQHIRERLHGNNPPPLFEYETAKKIVNATKNIEHKTQKPRQHLVDEVITSMMPHIENELRHRLFTLTLEELHKLLDSDG